MTNKIMLEEEIVKQAAKLMAYERFIAVMFDLLYDMKTVKDTELLVDFLKEKLVYELSEINIEENVELIKEDIINGDV